MLLIFTGLSAGALHVVSGPDHLAVVAPLVAENPSKGFQLGFRWGLGHGLGVVILGLLGMFVLVNGMYCNADLGELVELDSCDKTFVYAKV